MATMGYRPLYLQGPAGSALALVRGEFPGLGRLTARANLYAPGADHALIREAVAALKCRGIPTVKVGDTMWGVRWDRPGPDWPFPRTRMIPRHTFIVNLSHDERTLRKNMTGADRKIRKAENEGVKVREATGPEDIAAYCRLSAETSERVRTRTATSQWQAASSSAPETPCSTGAVAPCGIGTSRPSRPPLPSSGMRSGPPGPRG
jgi:hypothetical protein